MNQTTIKKSITFSGIGLHSGKTVSCTLRPAQEHTGILFHARTAAGIVDIVPTPDRISATSLATTISRGSAGISTVEHLLGALRGLSVDNVHIDVDGAEIPVLDGSALAFVDGILDSGIQSQGAMRRALKVTSAFKIAEEGGKSIMAEPYDGFAVDYTIDFPHPSIGVQRKFLEVTPSSFMHIARARTFGFLRDVEAMRAHGLALGGSLDNAIVLDDRGVLNAEGLRFADEFVRHKILDFIGDMAVLPMPLMGKFTVRCSGHAMNNAFARTALSSGRLVPTTLRGRRPLAETEIPALAPSYGTAALAG